ncbi:MAG: hypothetical protein R3B49_11010 [Phycisphaerales bacterium]
MALVLAAPGGRALASDWPPALTITADRAAVDVGETITWTLTASGFDTTVYFFKAYDMNILASDSSLAEASGVVDHMSALLAPTAGAANGASIFGASGGQSEILGGVDSSDPIVFATFSVIATAPGQLTYTVEDGGVLPAVDTYRVGGEDFGPAIWNGAPAIFFADTVTIVPAPAGAPALVLAAFGCRRRRRS